MKLVIAAISHETNTFSPVPTTFESFFDGTSVGIPRGQLVHGEAALRLAEGTNNSFAGMIDAAREAGAGIVAPVFANAVPSGPVDQPSLERMMDGIVAEVRKGCDGVMLSLHGAMVAQDCIDPESELARRIRSVLPGVPLAAALDFHANIGRGLIENADVVTGFWTFPHVDMAETGKRAARTLLAKLRGESTPVISWQWLPVLPHTAQCSPSREPMKHIMDRAIQAETSGEVLNASVFGGFPPSDAPETGISVVVVANDRAAGDRLSLELAGEVWKHRDGFYFEPETISETLDRAEKLDEYPIVLADHGNNAFGGGTCDTMEVLRAMLERGMEGIVAGLVTDPQAVGRMVDAGVGARIALEVGGKTDMPSVGYVARPLALEGTVRAITDGTFRITGPMFTGTQLQLGRTAVLDTGAAQVVVTEGRFEPIDMGIFTHCGVDPRRARYVLVQSRQHFRAGFEAIARHIFLIAGPGVCSSDYSVFRYERIVRPMYPLDRDAAWSGTSPIPAAAD